MPDPIVLNDLAGLAILNGKHAEAAKYLMMAAQLAETVNGKRVLVERAQEQANLAWMERYGKPLDSLTEAL